LDTDCDHWRRRDPELSDEERAEVANSRTIEMVGLLLELVADLRVARDSITSALRFALAICDSRGPHSEAVSRRPGLKPEARQVPTPRCILSPSAWWSFHAFPPLAPGSHPNLDHGAAHTTAGPGPHRSHSRLPYLGRPGHHRRRRHRRGWAARHRSHGDRLRGDGRGQEAGTAAGRLRENGRPAARARGGARHGVAGGRWRRHARTGALGGVARAQEDRCAAGADCAHGRVRRRRPRGRRTRTSCRHFSVTPQNAWIDF
jgi:hypothetical protein